MVLMKYRLIIGLFSASIALLSYMVQVNAVIDPSAVHILPIKEQVLWMKGLDRVTEYRIPIITSTVSGYLIAAVEARKFTGGDASQKFLAVRRSLDGGKRWQPQQFLLNDGPQVKDGLNLGAIVTDRITGTVFITYQTCGHFTDKKCTPTAHLINSTDEGVTWNQAVNISTQIGTHDFAAGPGFGIQKQYPPHVGRLIFCGHQWINGTFCILSDDHGKTWRYGTRGLPTVPFTQKPKTGDLVLNECQPVELLDGSIMLNMRNQHRFHCSCRGVAMSYDGADTFPLEHLYFDETLIEPACAAGLLFHNNMMFFVNPKSTSKRENLTLRWSFSNGTKWDDEYQIWSKLASYSTMTAIPNHIEYEKYVYILYEKGTKSACEEISLVVVSLDGKL